MAKQIEAKFLKFNICKIFRNTNKILPASGVINIYNDFSNCHLFINTFQPVFAELIDFRHF